MTAKDGSLLWRVYDAPIKFEDDLQLGVLVGIDVYPSWWEQKNLMVYDMSMRSGEGVVLHGAGIL